MFSAVAVSAANLTGIIPSACFLPGTEVAVCNGILAIENIKPGDMVLSYNEEKGYNEYKKVTQVFERGTDKIINIDISGDVIKTTPEHPFYVVDRGWTQAQHLNRDDKLLRNDGRNVIIDNVRKEYVSKLQKVYNFEVEDNHNYYVGKTSVLVHNSCGGTVSTLLNPTTTGILKELGTVLGLAGIGSVVIGGLIEEGTVDGGVLELPKSHNVEDLLEKIKEKVTEIARTKQKEAPNKTIVMRLGSHTISNFLPKGKDTLGKIHSGEDPVYTNDDKRGLSVFILSEKSLND